MARVVNTATNGVISVSLIAKIIDEVNRINDWLGDLGYERSDEGILRTRIHKKSGGYTNDTLGADDFKIFAAKVPYTLKKGKAEHGPLKVKLPQAAGLKSYSAVTATAISGNTPVNICLKELSATEAVFHVTTYGGQRNPTTDQKITVSIIAIAVESDNDND